MHAHTRFELQCGSLVRGVCPTSLSLWLVEFGVKRIKLQRQTTLDSKHTYIRPGKKETRYKKGLDEKKIDETETHHFKTPDQQ